MAEETKVVLNEIRRDPILGGWVIIDKTNPRVPALHAFDGVKFETENGNGCPFCPGSEHKTPKEITAFREEGTLPNTPGWWVRVVPSNNPILRIEGEDEHIGVGMYDMVMGVGAHEVIIETPDHSHDLAAVSESQIEKVIWAYRDRIMDLYKDKRIRYALVYKNRGFMAGATLSHSHSQLIGLPITPKIIREELENAKSHYNKKERCLFCDIMNAERQQEERVLISSKNFIAFCPYASRFPFEITIMPIKHDCDFTRISKDEAIDLGRVLKNTLGAINSALANPPYNMSLHTSPNRTPRIGYWITIEDDYHWHFEIIPRLQRVAGFEIGTSFYYNPTPPELAANILRQFIKKD